MGRLLLALAAALSFSSAFAGDFKLVEGRRYLYTGTIVASDLDKLKKIAEDGRAFEVVIDSNGGSLFAGTALGDYTRSIDFQMTVTVRTAISAAAMWAVGDRGWQYENEKSFVAWHLPWFSGDDGMPVKETALQYSLAAYWTGSYLDRMLGRDIAGVLMEKMAALRDIGEQGAVPDVNWFYVWFRSGERKSGHWSRAGWVWLDQAPSASAAVRGTA